MTLPHQEILDLITGQMKEENYDLRNLKTRQDFFEKVESLVLKYLNVVDFWGFKTQKENEIESLEEGIFGSGQEESKNNLEDQADDELIEKFTCDELDAIDGEVKEENLAKKMEVMFSQTQSKISSQGFMSSSSPRVRELNEGFQKSKIILTNRLFSFNRSEEEKQ